MDYKTPLGRGHLKHFYDKQTNMGFQAFRFKTLRKNLNPTIKRRKSDSLTSINKKLKRSKPLPHFEGTILSFEEWKEKTLTVKYMRATEDNKREIFKIMDETRPNRMEEILSPKDTSNMMSITSILDKYPKFKDYNGELIEREFLSPYPNGDTFLGKFVAMYVPKILTYIANDNKKKYLLELVDDLSDEFKALVLLPEILPPPNYKKKNSVKVSSEKRKIIPNPSLIRILDNQEDLLSATKAKGPQQPYIIYVPKAGGNRRNGKFDIRADANLLEISTKPLKAFDVLLKLHFYFDVEYAPELLNFYDFITGCVMGLEGIEPRSCCAALNAILLNIEQSSPLTVGMENSDEVP